MSFATDTDTLLDISIHGQVVTIIRNTPTYGDSGAAVDSWASVVTPNGNIQPISGDNPTQELGQVRMSTHRIFLPNAINLVQGDRIRPYGWVTGNDEYEVNAVFSERGHIEAMLAIVVGSIGTEAVVVGVTGSPIGLLLALTYS